MENLTLNKDDNNYNMIVNTNKGDQININPNPRIYNTFNNSNNTPSEKAIMGVFKIKKLSKTGWMSNERILVVTESIVAYYNFPKDSQAKTFKEALNRIYSSKNIKAGKLEQEEADFQQLCNLFVAIKHIVDPKKKEEIPFDQCEIIFDPEEKDKTTKFTCCAIVRQKVNSGGKSKEPTIYSKMNNEKTDKTDKNKPWVIDFFNTVFSQRCSKIVDEIKRKKQGNFLRDTTVTQKPPEIKNPPKVNKKEEETAKKEKEVKKEEIVPENDPEIVQQMWYTEICFQYLLRQYYLVSSNNNHSVQKLKYEFAIIQLTTKFKEICSTLVKRIVSDLYAKPTQSNNSGYIFPMVFPYPTKLKKSDQAVFLYYINGINFTLTWHQTHFRMRNDSKLEMEKVLLNGAWYHLKTEFKNRDFFQDLMIKLSNDFPNRPELPRYPISCIVDYCGFRVLCEADIYVDDGGAACGFKKSDMGMMPKEETHLYQEIANILSNERANTNSYNNINSISNNNLINLKESKDNIHANPYILISVNYNLKDKQQNTRQYHNYQHVIRYHSKQFKEVDNFIFTNNDILRILSSGNKIESAQKKGNKSDNNINNNNGYYNLHTGLDMETSNIILKENTKLNTNENNTNNNYEIINIGNGNEYNNIYKVSKEKLNEFFDLTNSNLNVGQTISLKDFKESIKYIMDLKVLIQIKDKQITENNKKTNNVSNNLNVNDSTGPMFPHRKTYFRPEFLVKYIADQGNINTNSLDKDNDSSEAFLKNLRKYLFLDDNSTTPNYNNIFTTQKYFKDNHINYFINCLDTMYFKPYDSETLTETFHQYGVNMLYLGLVAELTSAPHVRELCSIEMVGRICKKLIFDLIAYKLIERANEDYYLNTNDHGKDVKSYIEYDYNNSNDSYLQYVPVAFFIKYWKDYLKKIHVLSNNNYGYTYSDESNKGNYSGVRGLYKIFWHKRNLFQDREIKSFFQAKEDKTGGTGKNSDKNNEKTMLNEVYKEITKFYNVLFGFEEKYEVEILGRTYNNKSLWEHIFERMKTHFNVTSEEVFRDCQPPYISLTSLFNSIQHHTGIIINVPVIVNSKFSNKDLINKDFSEEWIAEIKPKVKVYSYRYFMCNKSKYDTIRNDYILLSYEDIYKKVLLRYFVEKFSKSLTVYTMCYLHFTNLLRRMDLQLNDPIVEWISKNDIDLKDKLKGDMDYYEFFKLQFNQNALKFESFNYLFLQIMESYVMVGKEESNYLHSTGGNITTSMKHSTFTGVSTDLNQAVDYISEFWFSKHPFICILYLIIARLNIKTMKSIIYDDKTETAYKNALAIAKDSLGVNNIFYANLCQEIGIYYLALDGQIVEGTRHLKMAYDVFKEHKEEFFECYMKNLKKITKYYALLGYYEYSLSYGLELVRDYINYFKKAQGLLKFGIDSILLNLIKIAKSLNKYEKGVELCKILLYDLQTLQNGKVDLQKFEISRFKSWKYKLENNKKKKTLNIITGTIVIDNNEKYVVKRLKNIIKIYLKLIIFSLKEKERITYIQALVRILESKKEKESLESLNGEPEVLFDTFFSQMKDEGDFRLFFIKILTAIENKYEQEKSYQKVNEQALGDIDKNYLESWGKFKTLYKIFMKNKVFTSFIDTDVYSLK